MSGRHRSNQLTPLLAILTMFLAPEGRAGAQDIALGTRVRITYDAQRTGVFRINRSPARAIGTLERRDSSGYVVVSRKREWVVPGARVGRVDVSRGRFRNVAGGALFGAVVTGATVLGLHFAVVKPPGGEFGNGVLEAQMVTGAALVGAAMGYAFPQERWRRVDGQSH